MIGRDRSNLIDVGVQVLSSLVGRSCYLILQIFLARVLGPGTLGLYAIGWTVIGLVSAVAPLGMPQAVIRFEFFGRSVLRSAPMVVAALIGVACLVGLMLVADPLANTLFKEHDAALAIVSMAPSVPLLCVFYVLCASLRASGRIVVSGVLNALTFVTYLAATLVVFQIYHVRTLAGAGYAYDIAMLLATGAAFALCLNKSRRTATVAFGPLIKFGILTMIIHTASILNLQVDRLIIAMMMDARAVGLYQVASQLAMIALVFRVAVLSVFEARVPKANSPQTGNADVTTEFIASTRILLHICVPGLVCLALAAGPWTKLLFGEAYGYAAAPLALLVVGQIVQSFTGPSVTALHMTGEEREAAKITLAAFAINVIGNLTLIPLFGVLGSAFATSVAALSGGFYGLLRLRFTGRLRPVFYSLLDIVCGTAAAMIPSLATRYLGLSSFPALICDVLASYLIYGLTVARLRNGEDDVFDFISESCRPLRTLLLAQTGAAPASRLLKKEIRGR